MSIKMIKKIRKTKQHLVKKSTKGILQGRETTTIQLVSIAFFGHGQSREIMVPQALEVIQVTACKRVD